MKQFQHIGPRNGTGLIDFERFGNDTTLGGLLFIVVFNCVVGWILYPVAVVELLAFIQMVASTNLLTIEVRDVYLRISSRKLEFRRSKGV